MRDGGEEAVSAREFLRLTQSRSIQFGANAQGQDFLSSALALPCHGSEGRGLPSGALLELSMQGNGAVEILAGQGRVVAGECDLRQVVERGLLLRRIAAGSNALEG